MIGEVESVDEVEIIRRMTEGIYDKAEYKKALAWVKEKCRPDFDKNPVEMQKTPAQKEKDWEFTAKMGVHNQRLVQRQQASSQGQRRRNGRS